MDQNKKVTIQTLNQIGQYLVNNKQKYEVFALKDFLPDEIDYNPIQVYALIQKTLYGYGYETYFVDQQHIKVSWSTRLNESTPFSELLTNLQTATQLQASHHQK